MNIKQLKEYRKMLYVIDMVNGFVREGVMHDKFIENAIPSQLELIEKFKRENEGISFIKDNHEEGCAEFNTFPPHCIIGTSEANLVDELKPYEKDALVYPKNSTSAMFANNMINDINNMNSVEEIVGCGCCTDICVPNFLIPLKNYFNQINKDVKIFVVKNATETYESPIHDRTYYSKIAYELMKQAGIIVVDNIQELEQQEKIYGLRR